MANLNLAESQNQRAIITPPLTLHPIFTTSPVRIAPVYVAAPTPQHPATGQNVAAGTAPTQAFASGTAPVVASVGLGFGSVGVPGSAISSSSTVSASPSFEAEGNVPAPNGAPNTSEGPGTSSALESAVAYDLPGGTLLGSLPNWFWFLAAALVIYLWYTGKAPRQVVREVTA